MAFDESKHLIDEEGKFTDKGEIKKTHLSKYNDDGKISFAKQFCVVMKSVLLALQMLALGLLP